MKPPPSVEWPEEHHQQKQLSDLFTTGSKLSEVPSDFRGIGYAKWRMLKITEQCSEIARVFFAQFVNGVPDEAARTMGKRIATPRDNYGWRS